MIRTHMLGVKARSSIPTVRKGSTNGTDWQFSTVDFLDEDDNKFEATLPDGGVFDFAAGTRWDLLVDVEPGRRLRIRIVDAKPVGNAAGKPAVVAA